MLMTTIMNYAVMYSFVHSNAHTLYCAMDINWMCDDYTVGVLFSLFCCCYFMYMVLCHSILCVQYQFWLVIDLARLFHLAILFVLAWSVLSFETSFPLFVLTGYR